MTSSADSSFTENKTTQAIIALVLLAGFVFHVFMLVLYLGPENPLKETLGQTNQAYISPLLSQDWHLFSPDPATDYRALAVRCKADGELWSEWFNPLDRLEKAHDKNPMGGSGKVLSIYQGLGQVTGGAIAMLNKYCTANEKQIAALPPVEELSLSIAELQAFCNGVLPEGIVEHHDFRLAHEFGKLMVIDLQIDLGIGPEAIEDVQTTPPTPAP